jgi:lariat debranching enzyme
MWVAVHGCGHGQIDEIYAAIAEAEAARGVKVDLLIVCGDFQAVRNYADLATLSCPPKYRRLGAFHKFYDGSLVAPVLTLFVAGNHEASSFTLEL